MAHVLRGTAWARIALLIAVAFLEIAASSVVARERNGERDIGVRDLPREAREVLALIHAGGPFRFERDGVVFGNRERSLPRR
ncbi:MAG TPA: ribonuclease domain-containing protein, partial [Casimicrobiaceae bacterium]|nr:ribonuclease domain-containing protein [Casimicrobiaceae bacterium]